VSINTLFFRYSSEPVTKFQAIVVLSHAYAHLIDYESFFEDFDVISAACKDLRECVRMIRDEE
jgi:hypothetical protein